MLGTKGGTDQAIYGATPGGIDADQGSIEGKKAIHRHVWRRDSERGKKSLVAPYVGMGKDAGARRLLRSGNPIRNQANAIAVFLPPGQIHTGKEISHGG